MSIEINRLSLGATFNFTADKKSAVRTAQVVDGGDGDERSSTLSPSKTLVDEDAEAVSFHTIDWLRGVGDICNIPSREATNKSTVSRKHNIVCEPPEGGERWVKTTGNSGRRASSNKRRSALRRHCDFWDADQDGVIYPWDIFIGFRRLGFPIALCLWAAVTMAMCFSYSTQSSYLPHPLFAIYLDNVHRNRHGSTTGAYDLNAELDTRRFDAIFDKYAQGKEYMTWRTLYKVWSGQRCANDYFGWVAGGLEWIAMYILLWPHDGRMYKDDIRGVYDGTVFWKIAEARAQGQKQPDLWN
ncbi:Caleosin-domain-containing protein [Decorospora gaudefroyi]|uniref:Caleosin-domain-containing protein n=1 Tax=Decorospora gaudefroyi TaxID=184978 RepID=A0A6A5KXK9_9PLEO|nr:Caleosin-domain-containing protein [Decorospora gaudefroyi]